MLVCSHCGEAFDERRYLVHAPGVDGSFDSVECAGRAVVAAQRAALAKLTAEDAGAAAYAAALARGYAPLPRSAVRTRAISD